jgi:hypothetical protein
MRCRFRPSRGPRRAIFRRGPKSIYHVEISKRITEDFGVSIGDTWSQIRQPGNPTLAGFGNLETTFQYQLMKDAAHEFAMLVGLGVEWGGTGNTGAGLGRSP